MSELKSSLLEATATLMMVLDRQGRILGWNLACSEVTEYAHDEVLGRCPWDLMAVPEDIERLKKGFHRLLAGEPDPHAEGYVVTKSGRRRWITWSHDLTRSRDGAVESVVAVGIDRTDAKQAEEALRVSEAKLAGIVSIASDAIITVDDAQRIVLFNEGAEQAFGWSRDEMLGRPLDVLLPERFRDIHRGQIKDFGAETAKSRKKRERPAGIVGLRKNGEEFPAEASISKIKVNGVLYFTAVLRDTTEDRRIERNKDFLARVGAVLAESIDYPQTLTSIAALAVGFLSDCCIIQVVEDSGLHHVKVVFSDEGKADLAERLRDIMLDRRELHFPWHKEVEDKPTLVAECTADHLASIAQGPEDLRLLRELAPVSYIVLPLRDRGRLAGFLALVCSDPRRRQVPEDLKVAEDFAHRAALALENARLYRVAHDAILARDQVLGIVAHDLRNPLNNVTLAAGALLRRDPRDDRRRSTRKAAEAILRSVQRADRLIQDILDVGRVEGGRLSVDRARVPSRDLLIETLDAFSPLALDASLELQAEAPATLPMVLGDRGRLLQVLSNLVGNAIKFTPAGGRIRIGAEHRGDEVGFWVSDTGPGIVAEVMSHIFDRFWQARRTDRRGTGLGLFIAKALVEAHGGRIWVESAPGQGSTFYFTVSVAPTVEDRSE
jgi:PAS domain S-box-containing protein